MTTIGSGSKGGGQYVDIQGLRETARDIRIDIVNMLSQAGSGHTGGSLSAADIMTALYFGGIMRHDPCDSSDEQRDRFILSKGHAAPVLYATLSRAGYFPLEELGTLRKLGSRLQGHPDCHKLPGIEASTGSLGQGLSIASGLALGLANAGGSQAVFVLLGDGELQEGQVWEAAMFAAHRKLGNLVAIIDNNTLQIDGCIDDVCSPANIAEKFTAFGWEAFEVDGHDMAALLEVLAAAKAVTGKPVAVIAHTIKGKGVSFMEGDAGWHGKAPSADQAIQATAELEALYEGQEAIQ